MLIETKNLVFSGHETFPLRQSWLNKLVGYSDFEGKIDKSFFLQEETMAKLGVGKNMVSSIRHWGTATGMLIEKNDALYIVDEFATLLNRYDGIDPYLENSNSIWFMHFKLCAFPVRSTSWFWLFNRISAASFTKEDVLNSITAKLASNSLKVSSTTIERDIDTCIRCYTSKLDGKGAVEDASDSVLTELSLIFEESRGTYSFRRGPKPTISPFLFAYALIIFWDTYYLNQQQLSFDLIAYGDASPGKVFKLDEESIMNYIEAMKDITRGAFEWTSSGGIRQLVRMKPLTAGQKAKIFSSIYTK